MTNVSTVWIRQIESGYKQHARASTLGNICYQLGIEAEYLRRLGSGYPDVADVVADCVEAAILLKGNAAPGHPQAAQEEYIRDTPGLTATEKEQLVEALRAIRKQEPLGKDLWRRRGALWKEEERCLRFS